jgi:hypothetical protein
VALPRLLATRLLLLAVLVGLLLLLAVLVGLLLLLAVLVGLLLLLTVLAALLLLLLAVLLGLLLPGLPALLVSLVGLSLGGLLAVVGLTGRLLLTAPGLLTAGIPARLALTALCLPRLHLAALGLPTLGLPPLLGGCRLGRLGLLGRRLLLLLAGLLLGARVDESQPNDRIPEPQLVPALDFTFGDLFSVDVGPLGTPQVDDAVAAIARPLDDGVDPRDAGAIQPQVGTRQLPDLDDVAVELACLGDLAAFEDLELEPQVIFTHWQFLRGLVRPINRTASSTPGRRLSPTR